MSTLLQRLKALPATQLAAMRRGVEKESLRALPDGALALTPHPAALGSALTHPQITTDYCESQLELITGVHASVDDCVRELTEIHQVVYHVLGDGPAAERLWVASMPCTLPTDETIPIGRYGASNIGRAKSVYRTGLAQRYGRRMQTISGIHYNWSMPGLDNDAYFGLIRNVRRHAFLLLYLFGASPAVCADFAAGRMHDLLPLPGTGGATLHLPGATSLRMGRLGYQSDAQAALAVSYNSLDSYAASLHEALTEPYPPYVAIGIRGPGGEYNQLGTSLLQIENEFYGLIRPKRVIRPGERPLHALRERGVEYVEVRCIDLDPFEPVGIAASTMHFLDVFLLHCLLSQSPPDTPQEIGALGRNQQRAATHGREPGLLLERGDDVVPIETWAAELIGECEPIANLLDAVFGGSAHRDALARAAAALERPRLLPSARILTMMQSDFGGRHIEFARAQSEQARSRLLALGLSETLAQRARERVEQSIAAQRAIEQADSLPFEAWRLAYLDPRTLLV